MPRPTVATPDDVRTATLALLREAGITQTASAQSFRRAVSVRKVRAKLGGGNPSTIGRAINALETELVGEGVQTLAIPELPGDIAALMTQLWQAAVGVQLDDVLQLKVQAQQVADNAKGALDEAQLRSQVLLQELAELRAAVAERDTRLAQTTSNQAMLADQVKGLQSELQASSQRQAQTQAELVTLKAAQAEAIASARDRYDGLSKQLLQETAQQRQAGQVELNRMTSQIKLAEKREATQLGRIALLEADLLEVRAQRDKAAGEISALKYVNTTLKTQVDEFLQSRTPQSPGPAPKLARGRRRAGAGGKGATA